MLNGNAHLRSHSHINGLIDKNSLKIPLKKHINTQGLSKNAIQNHALSPDQRSIRREQDRVSNIINNSISAKKHYTQDFDGITDDAL